MKSHVLFSHDEEVFFIILRVLNIFSRTSAPVAGGWSQIICQVPNKTEMLRESCGTDPQCLQAQSLRQSVSFCPQLQVSLDELRWCLNFLFCAFASFNLTYIVENDR